MMKMREEMKRLKNMRMKPSMRCMKDNDFDELQVREIRRGDAPRRMESGVLRSDNLNNKLVQDRGNRIQVVGADVEALYPSLEAVEVAEIMYTAMMET